MKQCWFKKKSCGSKNLEQNDCNLGIEIPDTFMVSRLSGGEKTCMI